MILSYTKVSYERSSSLLDLVKIPITLGKKQQNILICFLC